MEREAGIMGDQRSGEVDVGRQRAQIRLAKTTFGNREGLSWCSTLHPAPCTLHPQTLNLIAQLQTWTQSHKSLWQTKDCLRWASSSARDCGSSCVVSPLALVGGPLVCGPLVCGPLVGGLFKLGNSSCFAGNSLSVSQTLWSLSKKTLQRRQRQGRVRGRAREYKGLGRSTQKLKKPSAWSVGFLPTLFSVRT